MTDPRPTREVWRAPAKINLWLEIAGRRQDGYHLLDTAYQAIDLADTVVLAPGAAGGPAIVCGVVGDLAAGIPADDGNLAVRAARAVGERTGHRLRLELTIEKAIPPGAGLGGGSSDAAAVLLALAKRFAVPDPRRTLHDLAADLGADVPFFLQGGTRIGRGIGDELKPADPPEERWGVLAWPGTSVETAAAYRWWDEKVGDPHPTAFAEPTDVADWTARRNDLEAVVFDRCPEVRRAVELLAAGPAVGARMSGSGSAAFALYANETDRDADLERVEGGVADLAPEARAWPFDLSRTGVDRVE
ncbi:MAG: 4-(cytidine 5'-diphospho)-2-C-methyl-D-erythritol kinase [Gemmatimonadota bacterium]|nr:4-(cytidine 5'-diphospho)-2-C-methyl-D-erythritol kinase [Gemmatimonadota bacterium]